MKKTILYERHVSAGAKMVEFAGWLMPVQYSGVLKEHEAVRNRAGIFDVSHMGEFIVSGADSRPFLNRLLPNDVSALDAGKVLYSVMCNEKGGAVDDLLVYCLSPESFLLVVNASNIEKDFEWIVSRKKEEEKVEIVDRSDGFALIAVQGPKAMEIFRKIADVPDSLKYYTFFKTSLEGADLIVSRTGYTGEDGVEIYVPPQKAGEIWDMLLEAGKNEGIAPAGLAVRDLLRIEAGYSLYGHELDEETDPISAGLSWSVKMDKGDFIGKAALSNIKPQKKRIAFIMEGRNVPREGYPIMVNGEEAGKVTSGTFSPVLQKPVGIGYIAFQKYKTVKMGEKIGVNIRGKEAEAKLCKTPFIKTGVKKNS